jgi:hypothetical protein
LLVVVVWCWWLLMLRDRGRCAQENIISVFSSQPCVALHFFNSLSWMAEVYLGGAVNWTRSRASLVFPQVKLISEAKEGFDRCGTM